MVTITYLCYHPFHEEGRLGYLMERWEVCCRRWANFRRVGVGYVGIGFGDGVVGERHGGLMGDRVWEFC